MLVFRKTAKGWLWFPGKVPSSEQTSYEALSEWADGMEAEWRLSWREVLMKPSVKLDKLVLGEAPTDREVKALVREWLDALERKDLGAALAASAWLGGGNVEIPMKALRNISYELANTDGGKAELAAIHRSGPWVAVTVLRVSGERIQRLFLPVTGSPSGPRLLPEIDLIDEDTRTRNFLNKASFERLGKFVGEEELAPLIKLFEESREKIE
jgi:hypothetical protein